LDRRSSRATDGADFTDQFSVLSVPSVESVANDLLWLWFGRAV
jgi:hypothetical protein